MFVNFKPIIINIDAIIKVKYVPVVEIKIFPVTAQIIPIIEKTMAEPNTKSSIWIKVFKGDSFEYPPI